MEVWQSMPSSCCTIGCTNYYSKEKGVRLNGFPRDLILRRRDCGVEPLSWKSGNQTSQNEYFRVCGGHFISNEPFSGIVLTVSRCLIVLNGQIFHCWLDSTSRELKHLVDWPVKEWTRSTLPKCFDGDYRPTSSIIVCLEVFMERPTSLIASTRTFLNYKDHSTVKFLTAISLTGATIFTSKCWGGRVSDKHLTVDFSTTCTMVILYWVIEDLIWQMTLHYKIQWFVLLYSICIHLLFGIQCVRMYFSKHFSCNLKIWRAICEQMLQSNNWVQMEGLDDGIKFSEDAFINKQCA